LDEVVDLKLVFLGLSKLIGCCVVMIEYLLLDVKG
jgi:hypothetical protein